MGLCVLGLGGRVYMIDQTLFVDSLILYDTGNLNFFLLSTQFGLMNEVHIHTFHVDHYLTAYKGFIIIGVQQDGR